MTQSNVHPSLLLMLKILELIEAERDRTLGYDAAIQALEAAAVLLRAKGTPEDSTFDLMPNLKIGGQS